MDTALVGDQFPPAYKETAGGDRGCAADKPRFGTVGIVLDDQQSINDLKTDPAKHFTGKVNGRPSLMDKEGLPGSTGDCVIYLEVAAKARVMVNVALSTGSTDEACTFIESFAKKVEPQLPKVN